MLEIIVPAHEELVERQVLEYQYINMPSAGFYFDCFDGNPVLNCPEAFQNYKWCKEHPDMVIDKGIKIISHRAWVPAYVRCECSKQFFLQDSYHGCCQCVRCGTWHSILGQEMLPPDQWQEDLEPDL